jgi:hypothetical protein
LTCFCIILVSGDWLLPAADCLLVTTVFFLSLSKSFTKIAVGA